jgi:hemerythrin-like domain-containing protein
MDEPTSHTRRRILAASGAAALVAAVGDVSAASSATDEHLISPNEDLMQEHGLVGRVILIYRRCMHNIEQGIEFDPSHIATAARIVAHVIHGHHELEEERILFPIVQRRKTLSPLIAVLVGQHQAARGLTGTIANTATAKGLRDPNQRGVILNAMREFASMYEPHGAYEDTVVYPAFRAALSAQEYLKYSRMFAAEERKANGVDGFEKRVVELTGIENALGISLSAYTEQAAPLRESEGGRRQAR